MASHPSLLNRANVQSKDSATARNKLGLIVILTLILQHRITTEQQLTSSSYNRNSPTSTFCDLMIGSRYGGVVLVNVRLRLNHNPTQSPATLLSDTAMPHSAA